jgi:hypothetical protein
VTGARVVVERPKRTASKRTASKRTASKRAGDHLEDQPGGPPRGPPNRRTGGVLPACRVVCVRRDAGGGSGRRRAVAGD